MLFMTSYYGWVSPNDIGIIERSLSRCIERFGDHLNLLEVGTYRCDTSRGVMDFLYRRRVSHTYYGIDSGRVFAGDASQIKYPKKNFVFIEGDSSLVHNQCPNGIHWALIDACHCLHHATLDILNFGPKIVKGGAMLFHDIAPQAAGPSCAPGHNLYGVRQALMNLGFYDGWSGWKLVEEQWERPIIGGMAAFEKVQ